MNEYVVYYKRVEDTHQDSIDQRPWNTDQSFKDFYLFYLT